MRLALKFTLTLLPLLPRALLLGIGMQRDREADWYEQLRRLAAQALALRAAVDIPYREGGRSDAERFLKQHAAKAHVELSFIASGIEQEHRGGVDVASRPGRGARSDLYLPRQGDAA